MNTEATQQTLTEKIENYFETQIDLKDFAQQIRRANYILSIVMMQPDADQKIIKSNWVNDCFYHLNEFAELLDPILEKE